MRNSDWLFYEASAAAQSQKNFWTRSASTYRCMEVGLNSQHLIIKPQGFIGLIIRILSFDLDHNIPTDQIKNAKVTGNWFDYGRVEVGFIKDGKIRKIVLYLKNHDVFMNTIKQALQV